MAEIEWPEEAQRWLEDIFEYIADNRRGKPGAQALARLSGPLVTFSLVHLDSAGPVQSGPGRPGIPRLKPGMTRDIRFDRTRVGIHHLEALR